MLDLAVGDRVELIRTNNPYTRLIPGDHGTVTSIRLDQHGYDDEIHIRWDSGSGLTMLPAQGDIIHRI